MIKNVPYFRSNREPEFFDGFFRPFFDDNPDKLMKTDIREENGNIVYEIELAGYSKEEIEISLEKGYMKITATKEENKGNEAEANKPNRFIRRERFVGTVSRSYYVGDIKEEDISAKFVSGVLTIAYAKDAGKKAEEKKRICIE